MLAVEERGKFADPLTIAAQSRDDTFEERLLMRLKDDRDKKGGKMTREGEAVAATTSDGLGGSQE